MNQKIPLQKIRCIDKGGFSEVFLVKNMYTNQIFALKKIDEKKLNYKEKGYVQNEINILKSIKHPNIIKLYDNYKKNDFTYLILEYCNGQSLYKNLYDYINKYGTPFPEKLVRYFMKKILLGLKHLHENKIIHRDLKLKNILLKYNNEIDKQNKNYYAAEIKIIDFNISFRYQYQLNNAPFTVVGTIPNMPPSIVNNIIGPQKIYDEKIDIWSLGTLCYEMLYGKPLFSNMSKEQMYQEILTGNIILPHTITKPARSFLSAMLQKDGKYRLSARQLLSHEFIKGIVNNNIIFNNRNIINNPNPNPPNNVFIQDIITNQAIKNRPKLANNQMRRNNTEWNGGKEKIKIYNKQFYFNKKCNGCGIDNIYAKLYKCKTCYDVNYCEICYKLFKHTHIHPFALYQKIIVLPEGLPVKKI